MANSVASATTVAKPLQREASTRQTRQWTNPFQIFVSIAFAICICGLFVLNKRNDALVVSSGLNAGAASREFTLLTTMRRNIQMDHLNGKILPESIIPEMKHPKIENGAAPRHFIVMLYTAQACERSIADGLKSVNAINHLLQKKRLASVVVAAVQGSINRTNALIIRQDGGYTFPFVFADPTLAASVLFDLSDNTFTDEPIYMKVDRNYRVISSFHGDQHRPQLLDQWLAAVADQ